MFFVHELGERTRNVGKRLTHLLQADAGVGVGQSVALAVGTFQGDGKVLVFLQRAGKRAQRTEHAVSVDYVDLLVHGRFSFLGW